QRRPIQHTSVRVLHEFFEFALCARLRLPRLCASALLRAWRLLQLPVPSVVSLRAQPQSFHTPGCRPRASWLLVRFYFAVLSLLFAAATPRLHFCASLKQLGHSAIAGFLDL